MVVRSINTYLKRTITSATLNIRLLQIVRMELSRLIQSTANVPIIWHLADDHFALPSLTARASRTAGEPLYRYSDFRK